LLTLEHEGKEYKYVPSSQEPVPKKYELLEKWVNDSLSLWKYNRLDYMDWNGGSDIDSIIASTCEWKNQCCLIDNFAEGLDWEQAAKATNKIMRACETHNIQFIIATVNRDVMNKIPLKHWTLLDRKKDKLKMYNIHNSKKQFDEFEFTGLNNFDLLTTDYLSGHNE